MTLAKSKSNNSAIIVARLSARLAAQFVRERPYDYIENIADDAAQLAAIAASLVVGRAPSRRNTATANRREAEINTLARKYGGNIVKLHDPRGLWLGIKFTSPRYHTPIFPLI